MRRLLLAASILALSPSFAAAQSAGAAPQPMGSTAGMGPSMSVSPPPPSPPPPAMPATDTPTYASPAVLAAPPRPRASSPDAALPPEPLARAALEAHPDVVAAKARLAQARAEAERLRVGEYETSFDGGAGVRHVSDYYAPPIRPPGALVGEGYIGAQRTFRLPGKARLDRQTGALGVETAADEVDDARHQTGQALADAWFAWVRTSAQADLDRRTIEGARTAGAALKRRVELKDAAPLELAQVLSAEAVTQAKAAASAGEARQARIALAQGFPELPLPARAPVLPDPVTPSDPPGGWQAAILARSHEIRIAELKAQEQRTIAARARLDERPDPTFGVRAFDEQGDRERGGQLTFSIPFGGARRSAIAAGETAKAGALEAQAVRVHREIDALAGQDVAAVDTALLGWRAGQAAADAAMRAARLQQRAYQLGAIDLSQTLLSNGSLYDALRAEIDFRTAAWAAVTKLRLDAHALWADAE